eukprot:CAMPEP_0201680250 /NCGR_PEP_ID=MMETSP0494-20130426/50398_1 /ASSEMBLY_ACC=CAM_ASM_000839 /TAXON_ID=420259 /ORGANISM="Thalassiosira gravida, Strain GMp14c1" /LENGTH=81 /DNA_ID=CAMNT_0048163955 /DNA_START=268 /DNA_END=514 /DNA_ORIENTATION=+
MFDKVAVHAASRSDGMDHESLSSSGSACDISAANMPSSNAPLVGSQSDAARVPGKTKLEDVGESVPVVSMLQDGATFGAPM